MIKHIKHKCPYCRENAHVTKFNVDGNTIHSELKCSNCGAIFGHYTVLKGVKRDGK